MLTQHPEYLLLAGSGITESSSPCWTELLGPQAALPAAVSARGRRRHSAGGGRKVSALLSATEGVFGRH